MSNAFLSRDRYSFWSMKKGTEQVKEDWQKAVLEYGIEVIGIYPNLDRTSPGKFLREGKAHVRINRLNVEIRAIAFKRRTFGKRSVNKTRWHVRRLGKMWDLPEKKRVFSPTVSFFEGDCEIWEAIRKLILYTIKNNPLPYQNKERLFPFEKLPHRIKPPPPGETCPESRAWTDIVEDYGIEVIEIYSRTGLPIAGTKEKGSCHIFIARFGIEIRNIQYKTNPNWTARFIVRWPSTVYTNVKGEEEVTPVVTFLENSRVIWRAVTRLISKEVATS